MHQTVVRNKKPLLIGLFCTIVISILSFAAVMIVDSFLSQGTQFIELRSDGFHPKNVTIKEGDTVVFSSKNNEAFWPASNVHPTHTAFPDFDPKKPVGADETWSFTFLKAGTYGFHDHIRSNFEGEITVVKKDGTKVLTDCSTEKNTQCWEKMMLETLETKGIEATFNQLVSLSETEPNFANDCHSFSHLIGEKAYQLYVKKQNFELTPATALCGYGFYHGFMETLLLTTGNIEEAREFCKYVDRKLSGQASAAATACYHGTGHGAIDGSDPTAWGDVDAMMAPGFKLCSLLAEDEFQTYLCETGVYNAIEVLSNDPKYGISWIRTDPFKMCNTQTLARREGCYSNMLPVRLQATDNDFVKTVAYIDDNMIDKDAPARDGLTTHDMVILGVMLEYIRVHGEEEGYAERGIALCRSLPEDDHLPCIQGLSGGHIKYGEPGVEYVKNLEFCENTLLTLEEKDNCYEYTLPRMSGRYTPEKTEMICNLVDAKYRDKYCPKF